MNSMAMRYFPSLMRVQHHSSESHLYLVVVCNFQVRFDANNSARSNEMHSEAEMGIERMEDRSEGLSQERLRCLLRAFCADFHDAYNGQ